jgi:hypothetical protein
VRLVGWAAVACLLRVLAALILACMAMACGARVEGGATRSPVTPAPGQVPSDPAGMWAYTDPGELPRIAVLGDEADLLPLEHTDVAAVVRGHVAQVRVAQTFRNHYDEAIEVVYTFPLPENSAVHAMRMVIGERVIESEVQTRADARATYSQARAAGHTTALLEQERPNIFTQSVANIPPGEAIDVEIEYLQTLSRDGNLYEFVFPMVVGPRYIPGEAQPTAPSGTGFGADTDQVPDASRITPPIMGKGQRSGNDVSLTIDVHVGAEVSTWIAPTHTLTGVPTPEGFSARLADAETIPNRDFVLRWRAGADQPQATLFLGPEQDGTGHFSLVVQPPALDLDATVGRREMIFVIDTSGSMSGTPLSLAKQTLRASLAKLRPVDTFNVLRFAGDTGQLFAEPQPANEHNLVLAERFIDGLEAGGGTEMLDAVAQALEPRVAAGTNRYVFFVTDGYIGNEAVIMAKAATLVRRAAKDGARARVFGLGIGAAPNRYLIAGLSRAGQGIQLYVSNREHPGEAVERYFRIIDHPVLEQVELDWGELEVSQVYPRGSSGSPDLFASQAIVLLGRYQGRLDGPITLRAKIAGSREHVELPVTVLDSPQDDRILSTLWAREKIADLDAARWDGDLDEREAERRITQLGLHYGLVTAYTSRVAVDDSRVVGDGNPELIVQAVDAVEDVDIEMAAPSNAVYPGSSSGVVEIMVEAAPVQSTSSAAMTVSMEQARQLPVGSSTSRDFTAVVDIAPTASRDAAGISLAGTTGAESKYVVEGANITNPSFGTVGSTIVQEFVEEVDVYEAGYEAKYGGAAGGQITARRVSGTNVVRGEVGTRVTPRIADPRLIGDTDEALRVSEIRDVEAQAFAIVSGPIVRDRLFFTVGLAPGGTRSQLIQSFYRVGSSASEKFAEQRFKTGLINFSYIAGLDWRITHRHELRLTAQGGPEFRRTAYRLPHGLEPNAFGNPRIDPLGGGSRVGMGVVNDHMGTNLAHSTVVALDYLGRTFDDQVEINASLGFAQFVSEDAWRLDNPGLRETTASQWRSNTGLDLRTLLERDNALNLVPGVNEACDGDELACPIRTWLSGGLGEFDRDLSRRVNGNLGLTHYLDFAGYHRLEYGGAVDWNQRRSRFRYSGANEPGFYDPGQCQPGEQGGGEYCFNPGTGGYSVDNAVRVNNNRLILIDGDDPNEHMTWGFGRARHELGQLRAITDGSGEGVRAPAYDESVSSLDYAVYLQDRWALLSNLYIDAGVRWELQDLRDIYGKSQVLIWDNVAPRVGLVYDWTDEGRSRLYASYGHYYQPLPLQLNSRMFGGLVNVARSYSASDCEGQSTTLEGTSHSRMNPDGQPSEWCVDRPEFTIGAMGGAVVPRLRGQYNRQLQIGYEHEVVEDLVLGFRWLHSGLGRAVEDVSPNGGFDLILANPGVGVADDDLAAQRRECQELATELDGLEQGDERAAVAREHARCQFLVSAYEAVDGLFGKPTRKFDAWTLHLQKRFARNWMLFASYTFSRLVGNYDGYVDPVTGAINLGASTQYDDPELVRNSFGPLAGSIPHRFKVDGFYMIDLRMAGRMNVGASVRVQSGAPVSMRVQSTLPSYEGAHVNYLLPRGEAGRLAPFYQVSLSIGYAYPLPRDLELEFNARVINVTNAKATLRVDEVYSFDKAKPIAGGDVSDLAHAKVSDGGFFGRELVTPQRNFGVATQFQQPLSAQFELRLRF